MARLSFDIFCRVIDNFGDIGVCWRLARQLAQMPQRHTVRLWVDDLCSFARIEPQVDPSIQQQTVGDVSIVHWTRIAPSLQPHDIVIEAFACDPPASFLQAMVERDSLWINLEYLSAEPWVESCHALPSAQASGLRKTFFFPGFTPATGGLLRESELLAVRDRWLADPALRVALLRAINVPETQIARVGQGMRQVFLFCYPDAPASALVDVMARRETPTLLIVPAGVYPSLLEGQHDNVYVHEMPFVDQRAFDRLLWSSDLNFVRGEDSLVRALWAGKPLIWQIYPQQENAHMIKLQAWLDKSPFEPAVRQAMTHWNTADAPAFDVAMETAMQSNDWSRWQSGSARWCAQLAQYPDLTQSLVDFCAQQQRKG
ncbi:MAG TPA: elongation factor P maturation arginine rhamnosyltransferase EarP [Candidimonas sp.]|nr:elongation factor P maturation arginine rhamnosyltransferase EarP [Candidimonas sp.]